MSRFVTTSLNKRVTRSTINNEGASTKEYFERVGKYIPGEVIAGYTALNAFIANFPEKIKFISLVLCFCICWILTPLYFNLIATQQDMPFLNRQRLVSGIAFAFWAYAIDGN